MRNTQSPSPTALIALFATVMIAITASLPALAGEDQPFTDQAQKPIAQATMHASEAGKDRIRQGESLIERGNELINNGRTLISPDGKRLIAQGEEITARAKRTIEGAQQRLEPVGADLKAAQQALDGEGWRRGESNPRPSVAQKMSLRA